MRLVHFKYVNTTKKYFDLNSVLVFSFSNSLDSGISFVNLCISNIHFLVENDSKCLISYSK